MNSNYIPRFIFLVCLIALAKTNEEQDAALVKSKTNFYKATSKLLDCLGQWGMKANLTEGFGSLKNSVALYFLELRVLFVIKKRTEKDIDDKIAKFVCSKSEKIYRGWGWTLDFCHEKVATCGELYRTGLFEEIKKKKGINFSSFKKFLPLSKSSKKSKKSDKSDKSSKSPIETEEASSSE
ncbi:uncharacterized protein LOC126893575 [Daktulosphaira vitifoliae]|uniref:uncharacterized protein LOC126893575 n=1 Tax=Daktulosphaira vitifoliae TaxID=58002 RepID=UPI0021AAE292|nr:uncharacterized protein LOC126893575 [Daktulosphaira vitifoliae]XP_050519871.1 uncharacterized protein LOC126893575 [Daktulosphaira vitifoliae]